MKNISTENEIEYSNECGPFFEIKYTPITQPISHWRCYLFGNKPGGNGFVLTFEEDKKRPNFFIRFFMKICLGCTWVKE